MITTKTRNGDKIEVKHYIGLGLSNIIYNLNDITLDNLKRLESPKITEAHLVNLDLIQNPDFLYKGGDSSPIVIKNTKEYYESIEMRYYEKIPISSARKTAIKNLTSIIDGEITLCDKKIIKDIALRVFDSNLKRVKDEKATDFNSYESCIKTNFSEWARSELMKYGFKTLAPNKRIQDIDLNIRMPKNQLHNLIKGTAKI